MRLPPRFLPVVCALLAGCTATRLVERAELSLPNPPTRVWVTRADHTTVVFDSARVSADSLIGTVDGQPQRLPLSEVTALRVREPSQDRTAGLVFLGVSGVAAVALHFVLNQNPPLVCPQGEHPVAHFGCCGDMCP
jgi:hypothetical protein